MAKRKRQTTKQKIEKWLKEGRGQGFGENYKPWLTIQDVPSIGLCARVRGHKTNRIHHCFSKLELSYLYHLDFSREVIDIREQFPLDLTETSAIAQELGVSHPRDPQTGEPIVMTTDFLVTLLEPIGSVEKARTIKYAKDLCNKRTLQKFEIERIYWINRNVEWAIVTEKNFEKILTGNLEHLHGFLNKADLGISVTPALLHRVLSFAITTIEKNEQITLGEVTDLCDSQLELSTGSGYTLFCHLIATHQIAVDLTKRLDKRKRIFLIADGKREAV